MKHVERLTETSKLRRVASCWLYSENILAMHGNVKLDGVIFLMTLSWILKDIKLPSLTMNYFNLNTAINHSYVPISDMSQTDKKDRCVKM